MVEVCGLKVLSFINKILLPPETKASVKKIRPRLIRNTGQSNDIYTMFASDNTSQNIIGCVISMLRNN